MLSVDELGAALAKIADRGEPWETIGSCDPDERAQLENPLSPSG